MRDVRPNASRVPRALRLAALAALALFAAALPAAADQEEGASPYRMTTLDGAYVLDVGPATTGLYRNDGSTEPLWTVDSSDNVAFPLDATHLVRVRSWPSAERGPDEEALAFVVSGRLVRTYRVDDLVDVPWLLSRAESGVVWRSYLDGGPTFVLRGDGSDADMDDDPGFLFDAESGRLTVRTLQGDTVVFDVETGAVVRAMHPVREAASIVAVALLVMLAALRRELAEVAARLTVTRVGLVAVALASSVTATGYGAHRAAFDTRCALFSYTRPWSDALWRAANLLPFLGAEPHESNGPAMYHPEVVFPFWLLVSLAASFVPFGALRLARALSAAVTRRTGGP